MRPRGEIRQTLVDVLPAGGVSPHGALTWRDMAQVLQQHGVLNASAPSEAELVRRTVQNMVTADELRPVGTRRVAGARRPMVTYARAGNWVTDTTSPGADLGQALHSWMG